MDRPPLVVRGLFMTEAEASVVDALAEAWNQFIRLPVLHGDDVAEFRAGIHRLQEKVAARQALLDHRGDDGTRG